VRRAWLLVLVLLLLPLFLVFSYFQAGSRTLKATADAYVNEAHPDSKYGAETSLKLDGNSYIIFVKFDLSNLPSDAEINGAILRLKARYVYSDRIIVVHKVANTTWSEYHLTYNNKPDYASRNTDAKYVADDNKWYEWNVSSDVRDHIVYSWALKIENPTTSTNRIHFDSKEGEWYGGGNAPELKVYYSSEKEKIYSNIVGILIVILVVSIFVCFVKFRDEDDEDLSLVAEAEIVEEVPLVLYCPYCDAEIQAGSLSCENCKEEFRTCIICNFPVLSDFVKTPCCDVYAHRSHLREWLKIKGKCPNCGEKLEEWELSETEN